MQITLSELKRGHEAFEEREGRDAAYKIAGQLVNTGWPSNIEQVTDGIGLPMFTRNQAFYRGASFVFDRLEQTLNKQQKILGKFRSQSIAELAV